MKACFLAKKGLTRQKFDSKGKRMPVTELNFTDCFLVNIKTTEKDGYDAILIGTDANKKTSKSVAGQSKNFAKDLPLKTLKEFRVSADMFVDIEGKPAVKFGENQLKIGDKLDPATLFAQGDMITITSTSKGKGFAGVVKRHKFAGGPRTHGQTDRERAPGSIGQTTTPGRVYKGKRMAGRMGGETTSIQGLELVSISDKSLFVKGTVAGHKTANISLIS